MAIILLLPAVLSVQVYNSNNPRRKTKQIDGNELVSSIATNIESFLQIRFNAVQVGAY